MPNVNTYVLPIHGTPFAAGFTRFSAVREICPPGAEYGPQPLETLCLFATDRGGATARLGNRVFAHRAGSLLLIPKGFDLGERVNGDEPWEVHYLMMAGPWPDAMEQALNQRAARGAESFAGAYYHPAPLLWGDAVRQIVVAASHGGDENYWRILSRLTELFALLLTHPPTATGLPDPLPAAALKLLERHPERSWSVTELASALNASPRQLTYRLKTATGLSPALWIRQKRLAWAQRLLSEGHSVTETAALLGFANPYHFSRLFKAALNLTPSEYRCQSAEKSASLHQKN